MLYRRRLCFRFLLFLTGEPSTLIARLSARLLIRRCEIPASVAIR